jgi:hypothetical protein
LNLFRSKCGGRVLALGVPGCGEKGRKAERQKGRKAE